MSRLSHIIRFEEVQRHFILFLSVIDRFWGVFLHISVFEFFLVNLFSVAGSFNFSCKSIHDYFTEEIETTCITSEPVNFESYTRKENREFFPSFDFIYLPQFIQFHTGITGYKFLSCEAGNKIMNHES